MSNGGDCRTAPATPGLLKSVTSLLYPGVWASPLPQPCSTGLCPPVASLIARPLAGLYYSRASPRPLAKSLSHWPPPIPHCLLSLNRRRICSSGRRAGRSNPPGCDPAPAPPLADLISRPRPLRWQIS